MASLLVNGTPREIRFDHRALREGERLMTRAVLEVLLHHGTMFKADELAVLLFAAWRREHRGLTLDAVHETIQGVGVLIANAAVVAALTESGVVRIEPDDDRPPTGDSPAATPTGTPAASAS
jgi:hypothetical protein